MHRHRILLLLPIVLLISSPLLASEEGTFDRTLKVTGPVELEVVTGSGNITVRTGAADSVSVHATIRASGGWFGGDPTERIKAIQANPPIEQNGNVIRIGHFRDEDMQRNISISYELVTPAATRLRSRTGSGGQTIDGVRGPADVGTGSGNVRISNVASDVRASTGSGNIEANNVAGSMRAHTGSGSITGSHIGGGASVETRAKYQGQNLPLAPSGGSSAASTSAFGSDLDFQTGSGSIRVDNVRGTLRAQTGSGRIELDGQPAGDWNIGTGSGSITVHLPAQAAFNIYAHTSSGSITVDHPVTTQGTIARHEVRGTVRGGGFHLDIHTGSGNIRVE